MTLDELRLCAYLHIPMVHGTGTIGYWSPQIVSIEERFRISAEREDFRWCIQVLHDDEHRWFEAAPEELRPVNQREYEIRTAVKRSRNVREDVEELRLCGLLGMPVLYTADDVQRWSPGIVSVSERFGTYEEVAYRRRQPYWIEVTVLDKSGRSWVTTAPECVRPDDPEAFAKAKAGG